MAPARRCAIEPVVQAQIIGANGQSHSEIFLIDSGADRTVFRAALLGRLQVPFSEPVARAGLIGIGGAGAFVLISTIVELQQDAGGPVVPNGEYAVFTDPLALEKSVLGRDVLSFFDVILSQPRNEVLLLAPNHRYQVVRA